MDAGELEEALDGGGGDESGAAGGGDELLMCISACGSQEFWNSFPLYLSSPSLSLALVVGERVTRVRPTRTVTLPHLPLSFVGRLCGSPKAAPQYPRRIGSTLSFAMMMAARMAVATSLEVLIPRPTCPSESPMTTMALKRVR